jgi:hypothetical protein
MSARLAAFSLAILIGVGAAVQRSSAQSSIPPNAAGKKNPLLKLAEPWPDAPRPLRGRCSRAPIPSSSR